MRDMKVEHQRVKLEVCLCMRLPEAVNLFLHGLQVLFSQHVGCEEGFIKRQKFLTNFHSHLFDRHTGVG